MRRPRRVEGHPPDLELRYPLPDARAAQMTEFRAYEPDMVVVPRQVLVPSRNI